MKAISVQQPWAWLIANGHKDIENRDWTTDYRGFVLIHAGKRLDDDSINEMTAHWIRGTLPAHWKEAWEEMPPVAALITGGIVGYVTLQKVVTQSDSPWFRGKYGFVLTQRRTVDFIPLRGQLGLFDVPAEVEAQINEIRERRFWESEMKEQYQIKREWEEYRNA